MTPEELEPLISKTALLMDRHQRLCVHLQEQQAQLTDALRQVIGECPAQLQNTAQVVTERLGREGGAAVRQALQASLAVYQEQLGDASRQLRQRSDALANDLQRLQRASLAVLWKCVGTIMAALLLLLLGVAGLANHYRAELQRNQLQVELLRAYNRADVVLCGDGQLCANVDPRAPGRGDDGRYRPVRPRR